MLKPGDLVPNYQGTAYLPTGEFKAFTLEEYRGRWVTLFFWPLNFTFVCPTEIKAYDALFDQFDRRGCAVVGASVDSVHAHRAWCQDGLGTVQFPMVGDVTRELTNGFGVLSNEGVALRATFIINPQLIIESASVNALNVGRSAKETLRVLDALQAGGLTSCEWQPGEPLVAAA